MQCGHASPILMGMAKLLTGLLILLSGCALYGDDDASSVDAAAEVDAGEPDATLDATPSTACADQCGDSGWYCDLEECRCNDVANTCDAPCSLCTDLGYPGHICTEDSCACDTDEPFGPHIECTE